MFRSFYVKFSLVYVFFYALLLGFSLKIFFVGLKSSLKKIIFWALSSLIIFNGWPLISGKIVNGIIWQSKNVKVPFEFDPNYEEFLNRLKTESCSKLLVLPLTDENYQILRGKNGGGYFGLSTIPFLTGKNNLSGMSGFGVFRLQLESLIEKKEMTKVSRLFSLFGLDCIFYNSDDFIYDNFPGYPYSDWLKKTFPSQKAFGNFVEGLGSKLQFKIGAYSLYELPNYLPHFYIPTKVVSSLGGVETLSDIIGLKNQDPGIAVFFPSLDQDNSELSRTASDFWVEAKGPLLDSLAWETPQEAEVIYPFVKTNPAWKSKLIKVKEMIEERLAGNSLPEKIEKKLFFANKRIAEVVNLAETDSLPGYQKKITEIFNLLTSAKVNKEPYLKWAFEVKSNLKDNLGKLQLSDQKSVTDYKLFITQSLEKLDQVAPNFKISDQEYSLSVPSSGRYALTFKESTKEKTSSLLPLLEKADFSLERSQLETGGNLVIDEDGWIKAGEADLKKGDLTLKVKLNYELNLLAAKGSWANPVQQTVWRPRERKQVDISLVDGYELPLAKYYYSWPISSWYPSTWYVLEGRAEDKTTKIFLTEEFSPAGHRIIKEMAPDPETGIFKLYVKSSETATAARVFLSPQGGNEIKIPEIKVIPIFEPKVVLRSIPDKQETSGLIPRISFMKVNPTRYRVKIEGARQAFWLIFSENFNQGWKIFETGQKPLAEKAHLPVNGYANGWLINPEDTGGRESYELVIEFSYQKVFLICLGISLLTVVVCLILIVLSLKRRWNEKN